MKGLFKAAKRGGDKWSDALDRVRTSLRADDRLEPALQSAVIFHWLSSNEGQTRQHRIACEPRLWLAGMAWFDPNRSAQYSITWSKALSVLDRAMAHTLLNDSSLVGARSR